MYAVVVALYGFFTSFVIHESIVIVQILGLENLTSAFGLMMVFQGDFHLEHEHQITGAKKYWHPYLINTIEMRSL